MSYKPARASDAQIRRLVIEFHRLSADDDPRTHNPKGEPIEAPDERQLRLTWAHAHLGVAKLVSFSDLSATQAGYLLDLLAGKRTKLDQKLSDLFARADIAHPAEWFSVMCGTAAPGCAPARTGEGARATRRSKVWWHFRGCSLSQLNRAQKLRLAAILTARSASCQLAPRNLTGCATETL